MEHQFKQDRSHFEILSFKEADQQFNNHLDMEWKERFRLHQYLNSIAYCYANAASPKMDKTVFSAGKQTHG